MSVPVLLIIMMSQIEFYEIPDKYEIELELDNGDTRTYDCRCDISDKCRVIEIYDTDGYVIGTSLRDILLEGAVKFTVKAHHNVDLSEVR